MTPAVRPLRPVDEPAVRSLQSALEYADPDIISAALDGPFVGFVAVDGGSSAGESGPESIVGYAIALPGLEATLSELVVASKHRRSGVGRALVERIAAEIDAETLVVTTSAAEGGARDFYEAVGFAVDERLDGFYADGSDALRLVRRE